jgi:outer membrane protein TolC
MLKLLFVFVFSLTMIRAVYCEMLTLDDYLDMVVKSNSELKSVQSNIDAVKGKLPEVEKVYWYSLNAGMNYLDDYSGRPYNQQARLNKVTNFNYDISLEKQFITGTQVSLGLNGISGKHNYASPDPNKNINNYNLSDIAPFVELQQSLWKDINGGATKASIAKARANAKSALYKLEYKKQNILFNTKVAYWNLSYSRTVIDFRKLSLDRTTKILDWNQKRYNMDLAEKSDLLQSQAAVKLRELSLKLAYEEENKLNRVFNQFLNVNDEKVRHEVEEFKNKENNFKDNKTLNRKGIRADVLAALEDVQSALYDQMFSKKSLGADLVLSGKYALNGVEPSFDDAVKHITNTDKPSYSVGLKYIVPLNFKLRKTINKGYESAKISAQKYAEHAAIGENNDWLELVDNWNNAKIRLELAVEIEKIQQQRHQEDQNLLSKGRSTTYQVLQGEQDLDDAALSVLQTILELIKIYEQAEALYGMNVEV